MASIIKVDTIQDQDGNNIISEAANTITIGASGDTITIPSGATLSTASFSSTGIDDNATSTAITIDSSKNVGIGISSPTHPLTYYHSTSPYFALQNATTGTSGTDGMLIGIGTQYCFIRNQENQPIVFQTNGNNERMRIDSSGNVGINTTNLTSKFKVVGDADLIFSGAGTQEVLKLENSDTSAGTQAVKLSFQSSGFTKASIIGAVYGDGYMAFHTNNDTEKMRISASGNVGIGTSSPKEKLDSRGSAVFSGDHATSTNAFGTSHGILISSIPNLGRITAVSNGANDVKLELRGLDGGSANTNQLVLDGGTSNVGIGTSSPSEILHIRTTNTNPSILLQAASNTAGTYQTAKLQFELTATASATRDWDIEVADPSNNGGYMAFDYEGVERMRIDSSGRVGIGTSVPTQKFEVFSQGATAMTATINATGSGLFVNSQGYSNTMTALSFNTNYGAVGSITCSNTTSYNTTSDYRLKENVSYDFDATTRLKQLKPARFNFISDADKTVDGFIAHEVSDIVPEAITGTKDAVQVWKEGEELPEGVSVGDNKLDENGNTIPEYQGIDQSKLVPLLVKTIQELEARITQLENA